MQAAQQHALLSVCLPARVCRYADVQFSATPAKYIKYAAADVAGIIDDDLFATKAVQMGTKLSLKKEKLDAFA